MQDSNISFSLDEKQSKMVREFMTEHHKKHRRQKPTAIGGRFSFLFTPTSIGTACKVNCSCGEEKDVSLYEEW